MKSSMQVQRVSAVLRYLTLCVELVPVHALHPLARLVGFCIACIPISFSMMIAKLLARLFKLYQQGSFFTMNHVQYFHKLGYILLIGQLVQPIYDALMVFVLLFMQSAGKDRVVTIGFSSLDVQFIFISLGVLVISWIMQEGYRLQEEQTYTV